MFKTSMSFPYPVLKEDGDDYKKSVFKPDINFTESSDEYELEVSFKMTDKKIAELIENKQAVYAVQIECRSTFFRKIEKFENSTGRFSIKCGSVHDKVELCPCIIAVKDINDFESPDFSDDYKGMKFNIRKNEVLALGDIRDFNAYYEKDIINKAASIVSIQVSDTDRYMNTSFDDERIIVTLPKKQYDFYMNSSISKDKYPIMNSIVAVPALVQALSIMAEMNEEDDFKEKMWYKTIDSRLRAICDSDGTKYNEMLKNPVKSVQIILDNLSEKAFSVLAEINGGE